MLGSQVFFFNDTATTEIYTLSLHDALPISLAATASSTSKPAPTCSASFFRVAGYDSSRRPRSEEHTSELQSQSNLVCRLLLEKKKQNFDRIRAHTMYTGVFPRLQREFPQFY